MPTVEADDTYYVDLGPDEDFTDGTFISAYPENLTFDDQIANSTANGVGNCNFELSYSARDQDDDIVVSAHDFIGPYRSYFRLRYGDIAIMAGVVARTNAKLGNDFMTVNGKTWEHFTERWQYPFDGRTHPPSDVDHTYDYRFDKSFQNDELTGTGVDTPTGLVYQASNRDVIRIWSDLFSTTMNVPNRIIFDISNLATLSGIKTNFQFALNDKSFLDSIIQNLAGTGLGFDWWISWTRKLYWASPNRYGNPATPSIIYTIEDANPDTYPESLEFDNSGPAATHVSGEGTGLAKQTTLSRSFGYEPAQEQFSRLDASYSYGDIRNVQQLIDKTQRSLSRALQPQHSIPLTIDPTQIDGMTVREFWETFRKGRAIYIDVDLGYHRIDSGQQLVGYSAKMDNNGNVLIDYTLSQIYDLAYNAGSPEG